MTLVTSLAGCTGGDADDQGDGDENTETPADDSDDGSVSDEGIVDHTDQDTVTVDVGAGAGLQFAPAEIRITSGTTVTWEWTGAGGSHNVVAPDGAFESHQNGTTTDEAGYTFEHSFETTGTYEYVCQPHSKQGMVGSVEVTE